MTDALRIVQPTGRARTDDREPVAAIEADLSRRIEILTDERKAIVRDLQKNSRTLSRLMACRDALLGAVSDDS